MKVIEQWLVELFPHTIGMCRKDRDVSRLWLGVVLGDVLVDCELELIIWIARRSRVMSDVLCGNGMLLNVEVLRGGHLSVGGKNPASVIRRIDFRQHPSK